MGKTVFSPTKYFQLFPLYPSVRHIQIRGIFLRKEIEMTMVEVKLRK